MLYLEHSLGWGWNLGTSERRSEITWEFWNVVLEKNVGLIREKKNSTR
jgi:hypothetical protein